MKDMSAIKKQVGGTHYTELPIQPWEIVRKNHLDFWRGNVIKYVLRNKGGHWEKIEDLQKAIHYLEKLIEIERDKLLDEK